MDVDLVQGGVDIPGLVLDHREADPGGQFRGGGGEAALRGLDDGDGVGPRLAPHLEDHRGDAVQPGGGALLHGPVLRPADVPDPDGRAADRGDHQVVEGAGVGQAPDRPERRLAGAVGHVAPGGVGILPDDRVAHVGDGDSEGGQPVRLHPHVDRALQSADDPHLAHARRPLHADLHHLVRQLGQLAEGPVAGQGHRQDRLLVVVELRNQGRRRVVRQVPEDGGDAIAHVLGRRVDVPVEIEGDDHDGGARPRDRPQLVDPLDGVDDFLDPLRDPGFHFLRGSAGKLGADGDGGQVHRGKPVDAETEVAGAAHDDQGKNEHRREDGAADADFGELLQERATGSR